MTRLSGIGLEKGIISVGSGREALNCGSAFMSGSVEGGNGSIAEEGRRSVDRTSGENR